MNEISRAIFGCYFYPQNVIFSLCFSGYNVLKLFTNDYNRYDLWVGFIVSSFVWTFIEYATHRILHAFFHKLHDKHHTRPSLVRYIHTPFFIHILYYCTVYQMFRFTMKPEHTAMLGIFGPLYYLMFEMTHLTAHTSNELLKPLAIAKQYHKIHHIEHNTNYGFTSPFWDWVFGTLSQQYTVTWYGLILGPLPFYTFAIS